MDDFSVTHKKMHEFAHAVARVIIASYFAARALGVVMDPAGMQQFLIASEVPDYLRWPNAAFEFLAALAIMIGFQTRMASALLALYVFWSSFILNYVPGDPVALGVFWRDLAMIGGLLLLFSHGRGSMAVDNYFQTREDAARQAEEAAREGEVIDLADGSAPAAS
jgi:putative oxidoreductase